MIHAICNVVFIIIQDNDFKVELKVIQPTTNSDTETRLNYLESRIEALEKSVKESPKTKLLISKIIRK